MTTLTYIREKMIIFGMACLLIGALSVMMIVTLVLQHGTSEWIVATGCLVFIVVLAVWADSLWHRIMNTLEENLPQ